jgi:hypothetical protein
VAAEVANVLVVMQRLISDLVIHALKAIIRDGPIQQQLTDPK